MDDEEKREDEVDLSDGAIEDALDEESDDDELESDDPIDEMDAFGADHETNEKQWE